MFVLFATVYVTLAGLLLGFRYWEPTYEDTMNLIARLPAIAAYIYRRYAKHIILIKITHLYILGDDSDQKCLTDFFYLRTFVLTC